MVVEASEQVDAQAVSSAAVAVGFFEHAKDLQAADDVFDQDPFAGQGVVESALLCRQWHGFAPAFVRRAALGVELGQTLETTVAEQFRLRSYPRVQPTTLEEPKVVLAALATSRRQDHPALLVHGDLALERVTLFLAAVAGALLFLGRSTGRSVTSTITTSHC